MLLDAAVLTIIVGLIAGGRLSRLTALDLRAPWVFLSAAGVQVVVMVLGVRGAPLVQRVGGPALVLTLLVLLVGLWLNRHLKGVMVLGMGVAMNLLVISANGGGMPVDRGLAVRAGSAALVEALDSPSYTMHTPAGDRTRLRFLADVLPLPLLAPRPKFFCPGSIGDVLVTVGACWLILTGLGAFGLEPRRRPAGSMPSAGRTEP